MNKLTVALSVLALSFSVHADFVFDPAKWGVQMGAREGVKAEKTADGALLITLPAAATNRVQLSYKFGNEPLRFTAYPCLEMVIAASGGLAGGELYMVPPGNGAGGGHIGISTAYKAKNPNWWSHQRDSLIGCFHPAKQQVIVHMVNPREKLPAGKKVTIRRELVRVANSTTNHTIGVCYLRLPPNATGKDQTVVISSLKVLDEVPGDDKWLAEAKKADRELSAITCDYSDSSKMLEPPAANRLDEPFAVVKNGVPAAEIVLAPETADSPALKTAAEELQRWIKAITGVELAIRADAGFTRGLGGVSVLNLHTNALNRILLGKRLLPSYRNSRWFANDGWNEILSQLMGRDGFAIRRDPENPRHLHVFGVKDKGTMNGVFALLENNTDIIWARPDEKIGTVYTERKGDLSFIWGDNVVDIPDGRTRGWNSYVGREWMARNRCNIFNGGGGGDIEWTNPGKAKWGVDSVRHLGGHNIFHFLKGETDPWCYAHNDEGVRIGGQPCWSNPKTFAIFTSNVLNCARMQMDGPGKLYINLQDSWMSCLCSKCRTAFRAPDGTWLEPTDENFFATHYYSFLNKVAAELVKVMPEKKIVTLAYFGSLPKPACELHPAITIEWAPYPQQDIRRPLYNPSNRLHFQHLLDWHAAMPPERIDVYGYWGLYFRQFRPVADVIKYDIRLLNKWTSGCSSEVPQWREPDSIWDMSGVEMWTITRLYWDPYADPDQLRKYYIRRTFREAAPAIEKFYGTIREAYFKEQRPDGLGGGFPGGLSMGWLKEACGIEPLKGTLAQAKSLVKHPVSAVLVDRLAAYFDDGFAKWETAQAKRAERLRKAAEDAKAKKQNKK